MAKSLTRIRSMAACRLMLPLLLIVATVHAQIIKDIEIVTPRHFGYVVGDTIRHDVALTLAKPYRLHRDSLPQTGRLDRWLELTALSVRAESRDETTRYFIAITYQIINAPRQLETVIVPQQDIEVTDGALVLSTFVPQWAFTVAPITDVKLLDDQPFPALASEHPPPTTALATRFRRLFALVAMLTLVLIYLAFRRWVLPLVARNRRPFANACRQLQRLANDQADECRYAEGLRVFHHAVNETAGRTVFADGLDEFFALESRYNDLRAEVTEFFAASRELFFANPDAAGTSVTSLQPLLRLCRRCREIERAAP